MFKLQIANPKVLGPFRNHKSANFLDVPVRKSQTRPFFKSKFATFWGVLVRKIFHLWWFFEFSLYASLFTVILQLHSVNHVQNLFCGDFEHKKHLQKAAYDSETCPKSRLSVFQTGFVGFIPGYWDRHEMKEGHCFSIINNFLWARKKVFWTKISHQLSNQSNQIKIIYFPQPIRYIFHICFKIKIHNIEH